MPSAATSLDVYKTWILLLFRGEHQTLKLSEAEIADVLQQARCETSASEVHAALQMWGEESLKSNKFGSSLLSPPPEQSSKTHTPLTSLKGVSPFLHDGLLAHIELYGLPKGVQMPSHLIQPRKEERSRSQMLEQFLGSRDDPFVPVVVDARERRRQAALSAVPLKVNSSQCDLNVLDVDDEMDLDEPLATESYQSIDSPFFSDIRGAEGFTVRQRRPRVGRLIMEDKLQLTAVPQTSTSYPSHAIETPRTEEEPEESMEEEEIEKLVENVAQFEAEKIAMDFETQFCQSHGGNYSSTKRMRRFSTTSDEEEEESSKKFKGNLGSQPRNHSWRQNTMQE